MICTELNREITRRNEELGEIVRKKTETLQHRSASPPLLSPPNHPPTSSIPPLPPSSLPLPTSPPSVGDPSDPFNPHAPLPPCPQPKPANPLSEVNRSYFTAPEVSPQATSRTDPGGYPHTTMTIDAAEEDEGPPSPSAGAAISSSRSSTSSSGVGLLRRMVKSYWNLFLGDRGCRHGEGSNSNSSK